MAAFFKSLVERFIPGKSGPQVHLAAFGKHPGWNDHIDDLGLETDRLIAVKRLLYVQGMTANIDAGAWEKLEPDQRLDDFDHLFLWHHADSLVSGRLWSSVDGKGRDKYPMFVCAQTAGIAPAWTAACVLGFLEKCQQRCRAASTADAVVAALDADRAALRQLALEAPASSSADYTLAPQTLARFADQPDFAPDAQGFHRILYQINQALASYRPADPRNPARRSDAPRTEHLRVPRAGGSPAESAWLWLRLFHSQLLPAAPLLVLASLREPFLDIIVGDPAPSHLFCVRATPKSVPLASDIPYTLDAAFLAKANAFLTACRQTSDGPLPLL